MITFIVLALCNGSLAMTLTKSRFFRFARVWISSHSEFFGELASCPFCMSHWLAAIATIIWKLQLVNCGSAPVDYVASALALTGASSLIGGAIYRMFTPPTIRTQDLKEITSKR